MSTYKVNVSDLTKVIANGYKDILESNLRTVIKEYTDVIINEAVQDLAKTLSASVKSYYQVDKDNIIIEMYINKEEVKYK